MKKNRLTLAIAHAAGWIIFFSLVLGFLYNSPEVRNVFHIALSWPFLAFCVVFLFVFYFNTYLLIPKLYLEKKYTVYFIIVLALFATVYIIRPFDDLMGHFARQGPAIRPPGHGPGMEAPPGGDPQSRQTDIVSIILFITVWSLSTAICIIRQWRITEKRAIQAETDKVNAELAF